MNHTSNPIIKHKAGLLNLAEELGNVSKACKVMGVSRDTFYRYQELVDQGGIDALINKNRRIPGHRPSYGCFGNKCRSPTRRHSTHRSLYRRF